MARIVNRLSALKVTKLSKPGRYHDGGGLYLQVSAGGAKSWLFRYMIDRRPREMGLGSIHAMTLADAREAAFICRKKILNKIDPIDERRAAHAETAITVSFDEAAAL